MRPPETVYRGVRLLGPGCTHVGVRVTVNDRELSPARSRAVWNHSPTGFEWGYCGSGPAQLALALVLDATGSPSLAGCCYQWFKRATVANWGDLWEITAREIFAWLEQWQRENPRTVEHYTAGETADRIDDQRASLGLTPPTAQEGGDS